MTAFRYPVALLLIWLTAASKPAFDEPEGFYFEKKSYTVSRDTRPSKSGLVYGSPVKVIFGGLVRFYQKNISPYKNQSCPAHPTCSRFAYLSLSKYGFWGVLMTLDRMFYRENSSMGSFYLKKMVDGKLKFFDSPANNYIFENQAGG